MRTINCKQCGKAFTTNASRACYCSAECKVTGAKALRKEWERQHRTYNADYYRRKREENARYHEKYGEIDFKGDDEQ